MGTFIVIDSFANNDFNKPRKTAKTRLNVQVV